MKTLFRSTVVACALLLSGLAQAAPAEPFPVSEHGPQASSFRIRHPGTGHASARARVLLVDLQQKCLDDDMEGSPQCSMRSLQAALGDTRPVSVSANCPRRTITTSSMSSSFARRHGQWVNLSPRTGEDRVLDGSNASGAPLLDEQFARLCPGQSD